MNPSRPKCPEWASPLRGSKWIAFILSGLSLLLLALALFACGTGALPTPTHSLPQAVSPRRAPGPNGVPALPVSPSPTASPSPFPFSSPSPTPDRLAEPPLPENPSQLEWGRHLYWLNCMPCHGDRGQGLTDEFRALWVEDHQDCWARGCHAGRPDDPGFPLPRTIPPVISSSGDLPPFATAEQLIEYLRATHPPQNPGYLSEDEYWAIAAYLLDQNHRLPAGQVLGPQK